MKNKKDNGVLKEEMEEEEEERRKGKKKKKRCSRQAKGKDNDLSTVFC